VPTSRRMVFDPTSMTATFIAHEVFR
jgi:hypothetical protein